MTATGEGEAAVIAGTLAAALRAHRADMHLKGSRPCETCTQSAAALALYDEFSNRASPLVWVVKAAEEVYRPEGVAIWLTAENGLLDGRRPIDMIEDGDHEDVVKLLEALKTGAVM